MMILSRGSEKRPGFSLIELLTVIAVIAILASILIPVTGTVRRSAAESRTRAQFAQYATAYEAFRADHGFYPSMGVNGAEFGLDGNNGVFIQTLTGRTEDGSPATDDYARKVNPRRTRYFSFRASDFGKEAGAGEDQLVDGFGNPGIHVVIDRDQNGVIEASDFESLPPDMRPESLPGGVYFYSANKGDVAGWQWVLSWE